MSCGAGSDRPSQPRSWPSTTATTPAGPTSYPAWRAGSSTPPSTAICARRATTRAVGRRSSRIPASDVSRKSSWTSDSRHQVLVLVDWGVAVRGLGVLAGALDHDPIGLDRDRHRAVAGPV